MASNSGCRSGLALVLLLGLGLTGCGGPQNPQDVLRQQAGASFEKLDAKYLAAAHAAIAQADPLVPVAYELSLHALAVANYDLAQALPKIVMPSDATRDAQALVDAAQQLGEGAIACEALIASGSVCQASAMNDWIKARNAADRQLRKDLHLDPSEVPG